MNVLLVWVEVYDPSTNSFTRAHTEVDATDPAFAVEAIRHAGHKLGVQVADEWARRQR